MFSKDLFTPLTLLETLCTLPWLQLVSCMTSASAAILNAPNTILLQDTNDGGIVEECPL